MRILDIQAKQKVNNPGVRGERSAGTLYNTATSAGRRQQRLESSPPITSRKNSLEHDTYAATP